MPTAGTVTIDPDRATLRAKRCSVHTYRGICGLIHASIDLCGMQFAGSEPGDASRHLGSVVVPIRYWSIARAHSRPSRIAHTTSDWPRRMSPAENTLGSEVL